MDTTPTVLIVEDEPDLADLYAAWLSDRATVEKAYDGETALELLDDDVDIVLLDRMMPGLSGDRVLGEIRERGLGCRVAMVTAVEPDFDIIEMGFDDYLVKPVSKPELVDVLDQLRLRSTYDEQLREFFSLASKKVLLSRQKTDAQLKASEQYARLEDRLAVLDAEAETTTEKLLDRDGHRGIFQELHLDHRPERRN